MLQRLIKKGRVLKCLDLSHNPLGTKATDKIFESLIGSRLEELDLSSVGMTSVGGIPVQNASDIGRDTELRRLVLDCNAVSVQSYYHLATLICMSKGLETLRLRACNLEDFCAILICERMIGLNRLREMDLSKNKLGDAALESGFATLL